MRRGADDAFCLLQHQFNQPGFLVGERCQPQRLFTWHHAIHRDKAPFGLGHDLLGDYQYVASARLQPVLFERLAQQPGQIVTGADFAHPGQRVNGDHARQRKSGFGLDQRARDLYARTVNLVGLVDKDKDRGHRLCRRRID